ncbi:hypothetical protein ACFVTC_18760 [Streptomyces sp. NPDC057950]|uniref:hypothetical protein n=1 Tax=Streptomyces sp. NPDC057950 TaxID=3346288 RepID=UPI0036E71E11
MTRQQGSLEATARALAPRRSFIGADSFDVQIDGPSIKVARGAHHEPEAIVRGDVRTLWNLIFTDMTVASAIEAGFVDVTRNQPAAQHFFTLVRPPA